MKTILRKSLLYKSGLGFFCVNHVLGCSHGCLYPCWAETMARTYGRVGSPSEWRIPRLVENAAVILVRELDRKRSKPDCIHLCLTTDPFMHGFPEVAEASLELVAVANSRGIPCSILTKGILPASLADRGRFPSDNVHGISLVSLDESFRERWEPGTAPCAERLRALKALHDAGRATLVHMEPYPTPNVHAQDLGALLEAASFADRIYFGGWNYGRIDRRDSETRKFYREAAELVRAFCRERGIVCETGET